MRDSLSRPCGGGGEGEGEVPIGHQGVHHFGGRSRNESTIMQAISSVSTLNGANVNVKIVLLNDNSGNFTSIAIARAI